MSLAIKYCLKCTAEATSDTDHQNQTADNYKEWGNCFQPKSCILEVPFNITDEFYCTATQTCFTKTLGKQITRGCDLAVAKAGPCPYVEDYPPETNEINKLTVSWSENDASHSQVCTCDATVQKNPGFCNLYTVYHFVTIVPPKTTTDPDDGGSALEVTFLIFSLTVLSMLYSYM
ncbi:unnamed protein product [Allacma fusca]|uniref:Uncharacterized protein n=1 Tax=Allacma fusca TaxID=39272 RepID=A0A8J2LCF9_9HEXA|nr:unnamed protein product [Allacma fusca]